MVLLKQTRLVGRIEGIFAHQDDHAPPEPCEFERLHATFAGLEDDA